MSTALCQHRFIPTQYIWVANPCSVPSEVQLPLDGTPSAGTSHRAQPATDLSGGTSQKPFVCLQQLPAQRCAHQRRHQAEGRLPTPVAPDRVPLGGVGAGTTECHIFSTRLPLLLQHLENIQAIADANNACTSLLICDVSCTRSGEYAAPGN